MMYKHILIAADLLPGNEALIKKAVFLSKPSGTIDIVHVVELSPIAYGGEFSVAVDINLKNKIETAAGKKLQKIASSAHIPLERQHVVSGLVRNTVIDLAEKIAADLIIVAPRSHHGIAKLLGSQANAILHHAPCDVLIIEQQQEGEKK